MNTAMQIFAITLSLGLALVGAEIFLPGAVLGIVGGLCLTAAVVAGFYAFPGAGLYIAAAIALLLGLAVYAWLRFFPKSRIGRSMTVEQDLAHSRATDPALRSLIGKTGTTLSELRPSGYAIINGQRQDVITEGAMIPKATPVRVIRTQFNSLVVERISDPGPTSQTSNQTSTTTRSLPCQ